MKRLKILLMLVFCMGFFASGVLAADKSDGCALTADTNREVMLEKYLQGRSAYHNEQYAKALSLLTPAAEAGNPNAQYLLGLMNDYGEGMPVNHVKANEWYLKAAQQGQDDAQFNLAVSYAIGEGIAKNMLMSVCWVSKAAANGDQDAVKMLTEMANKNIPEAQYALAQIYFKGTNKPHNNPELYPHESDNRQIKPDKAKGEQWLGRARTNGYKE